MNLIDLSNDAKQKIDDYIAMKLTEIAFRDGCTRDKVIEVYKYIRGEI